MGSETYAEALVKKYKGKTVEILFDSEWGKRFYSEYEVNNKATLVGKIIDSDSICLNVEVEIKSSSSSHKRIVSINTWMILSVTEYIKGVSQVFAFRNQIRGKQ